MIKLMPIVWVTNMERSIDFYSRLGGTVIPRSRTRNWAELEIGGAKLALHRAEILPDPGTSRVVLCFSAEEPLENVAARFRENGIELEGGGIMDESFGRLLSVRDPDGLRVQVDEQDRDIYNPVA